MSYKENDVKKTTLEHVKKPHEYVHVLTDEIRTAFKIEFNGFLKKNPRIVDESSTIELINNGIKKYGNRYIGTFDSFVFEKPHPKRFISRCSYDELVMVFKWRCKNNNDETDMSDYDTTEIWDNNLSTQSLLKRKFLHIGLELQTMYPRTTNPSDPDYKSHKELELQMGPPSEFIGPNGKPFGDFKMRLIYDYILILLYLIHYVDYDDKSLKPTLHKQIKSYKNFTILPEFKIDELNEIINAVAKE